jgi:ribosomal-protein-alanine N-acetyltransferase
MTFETIETDRLILQKLDPKTMGTIFKLNNDQEIKKILGVDDEELVRQKKLINTVTNLTTKA